MDPNGVDDSPNQQDMTEICIEPGSSPFEMTVSFNFDDTAWSGANTGDGCILFDTDRDFAANYALCITVEGGAPATQKDSSPRLFLCDDASPDKCTSPIEIGAPFSQCYVNTGGSEPGGEDADPFANYPRDPNVCKGSDCLTEDTFVICFIEINDFMPGEFCNSGTCDQSGTTCSSDFDCVPISEACAIVSQQPQSGDPKDCIEAPTSSSTTTIPVTTTTAPPVTTTSISTTPRVSYLATDNYDSQPTTTTVGADDYDLAANDYQFTTNDYDFTTDDYYELATNNHEFRPTTTTSQPQQQRVWYQRPLPHNQRPPLLSHNYHLAADNNTSVIPTTTLHNRPPPPHNQLLLHCADDDDLATNDYHFVSTTTTSQPTTTSSVSTTTTSQPTTTTSQPTTTTSQPTTHECGTDDDYLTTDNHHSTSDPTTSQPTTDDLPTRRPPPPRSQPLPDRYQRHDYHDVQPTTTSSVSTTTPHNRQPPRVWYRQPRRHSRQRPPLSFDDYNRTADNH